MNTKKLNILADWLDQGAPHIIFDMHYAGVPLFDVDADDYLEQMETKGIGECGTVCCIAGYALTLENIDPAELDDWGQISHKALHILGLPNDNQSHGHDLFDPYMAPEDCTTDQASEAVRRVIAGEKPWG